MRCIICQKVTVDKCHIKSRGSGGTNDHWNIIYMCRLHHRIQHTVGWKKFAQKYPIVAKTLRLYGWSFTDWGKIIRDYKEPT